MSVGITPVDLVAPFSSAYLVFALVAFYASSIIPSLGAGFYFYKSFRKRQKHALGITYLILSLGTILQGTAITLGSHIHTHGFQYLQNVTVIRDLAMITFGLTASFLVILLAGKFMPFFTGFSSSSHNVSEA